VYLFIIPDMNATKKHGRLVKQGTMNKGVVHVPKRKGTVTEVNTQSQMKGSVGEVRSWKAEKTDAVEMEGEGNYSFSMWLYSPNRTLASSLRFLNHKELDTR
jgi:hypothetical protein